MSHPARRTEDLQQASFLVVLVAVTLLMVVVVYPFAQPLLWAGLAAIMFQPLYRWMLRRLKGRRNPAAGLSLLVIFVLVIGPAAWIGSLVVQQALVLVDTIQKQPPDLAALFDQVYTSLPRIAREAVDRAGWADIANVQRRIQDLVTQSAGLIATQAVSIGSGALSFFLSFGVALYVMFFLLRDGERVGRSILCAIPVQRSIADRLAERFLGIVRATIKGTGVVALVQGALGWIAMMICGVPSALLFGVVMAIFALIPVIGAGGVWLPVGVWLLASGSTWQGMFMLVFGFFVISSADNVLRPILVG
ncbi:MAG: AI-2E family transporter, partial [Erythrobacter sp.]